MIVSDAGKPFAVDERPTEPGAAILVEAIDILTEQVRGLQFKRLELNGARTAQPSPAASAGTAHRTRIAPVPVSRNCRSSLEHGFPCHHGERVE